MSRSLAYRLGAALASMLPRRHSQSPTANGWEVRKAWLSEDVTGVLYRYEVRHDPMSGLTLTKRVRLPSLQ